MKYFITMITGQNKNAKISDLYTHFHRILFFDSPYVTLLRKVGHHYQRKLHLHASSSPAQVFITHSSKTKKVNRDCQLCLWPRHLTLPVTIRVTEASASSILNLSFIVWHSLVERWEEHPACNNLYNHFLRHIAASCLAKAVNCLVQQKLRARC